MTITNSEKERLNVSMPVANDIKLGDIIAKLQEDVKDLKAQVEALEGGA